MTNEQRALLSMAAKHGMPTFLSAVENLVADGHVDCLVEAGALAPDPHGIGVGIRDFGGKVWSMLIRHGHLLPPEELEDIEDDYKAVKEMIVGQRTSGREFVEVVKSMKQRALHGAVLASTVASFVEAGQLGSGILRLNCQQEQALTEMACLVSYVGNEATPHASYFPLFDFQTWEPVTKATGVNGYCCGVPFLFTGDN